MTLDLADWTSDSGAALRERAASACERAEAECGDAARLAEVVSVIGHSFAAEATSIRCARTIVVEFATRTGFTEERIEAIKLAVSEAVSNAVTHAYPDGSGDFRVRAVVVGRWLVVWVSDDGCGPDAPPRHPGLGYGVGLIAASTDLSAVKRRRHGGTEVVMRWKLA